MGVFFILAVGAIGLVVLGRQAQAAAPPPSQDTSPSEAPTPQLTTEQGIAAITGEGTAFARAQEILKGFEERKAETRAEHLSNAQIVHNAINQLFISAKNGEFDAELAAGASLEEILTVYDAHVGTLPDVESRGKVQVGKGFTSIKEYVLQEKSFFHPQLPRTFSGQMIKGVFRTRRILLQKGLLNG